ncbi:S8 family serine peptidase [Saprospira sp. CCB-QB6]|uniref:S8 family serine peptidase n=1 Tax=Saprospira sp. CCB-QB6 TaxID=3023936 RepID=UPI00234A95A6|nr:S8 family serine peptidase [Saprospira sp. CCB-QB6]WCL82336.1 S8 family serine peptidase [Saprospira sp. CCB-QB6]
MRILYAFAAALLLSSFGLQAQTGAGDWLELKSGREFIAADLSSFSSPQQQDVYQGKLFRLANFSQLPNAKERAAMNEQGIVFLEYLPKNTYLLAIPARLNIQDLQNFGIRGLKPLAPKHKMDARLDERPFPIWAMQGQKLKLFVQIHQNINWEQSLAQLQAEGYPLLFVNPMSRTLVTSLAPSQIENLAKKPFVRYLDLPSDPGQPESDDGRNLHRANLIDGDYYGAYAYNGEGVAVAINDDGFVGPHIDFKGRANQQDVAGDMTGTHGDMTVGIVGGAGNLNPIMRGMAPNAYLHVRQYNSSLPATVALHQDSSVMVFSSSYSNGCNAGYTTLTRTVDQEIYNNPNLIQVFSGGNSNGSDCGYGAGSQWGNITGGHKMGKNVLATANLHNDDDLATSSSRGPASDGRIKPDIAAHGQGHVSTDPDNSYAVGGGTSAAAPGIAGVLTQLHQAYRSMNAGTDAPSALLKAALLNSANDLGNDGPDFSFGWGKVNAYRALKTLEDNRYINGAVGQAASATHTINIPANVRRAKIMIYWHDKEASTSSTLALVNNLDLSVNDPSNTTHFPWILDPAPLASTLALPATKGVDTLNNVEQVAIDNPSAGTYTINVAGTSVPFGPQNYYIVYEFLTDEIMLTYPVGGEGLIPGTQDRIHWDAYGTTNSFNIEYSADNGNAWSTVQTNVAGSARFIDWTVPATVTGQGLIRITRGTNTDLSDANFSILETPQNIRIVAVCTSANTVRINWDAVAGATEYDVFVLGATHMDSIGSTATLSFDVPVNNINDDQWFSVRAKGPNGLRGRRAIAVQMQGGNSGNSACMMDCSLTDDAGINQVFSPQALQQSCNGDTLAVDVELTNISNQAQSNFEVYYQLDNQTVVTDTFTGTLAAGSLTNFSFSQPVVLAGPGQYQFKVWTNIPGDGARCNDTISMTIDFNTTISSFPYIEDFESGVFPPANSYLENNDASLSWREDNVTGSNGSPTTAIRVNNFSYNAAGEEDVLGFFSMDLTNAPAAQLSFDVAYAAYSSSLYDGLRVEVSTDCGQTYSQLYFKENLNLATAGTQTGQFSPSDASDWRTEIIDLAPYVGNNVAFRFVNICGFGNDLFLDNININTVNNVPTTAFNVNSTTSCSGAISFTDQSTNSPTSWSWDFGDGNTSNQQNPNHQYASNGSYTVQLITSNQLGSDTLTQTNYITVNFPSAPSAPTTANGCVGQAIALSASSTNDIWWSDANGNLLFEGQNYNAIPSTTSSSYLVQSVITSPSQQVGPATPTTVGPGGYFTGTQYLNFDASGPIRIVSVLVDANTAGNRTIELYDAINGGGTLIQSTTVNVPSGQSRVTLNFVLPAAGTYSIGGTAFDFYRNSSGANYPYSVAGLISITGSSFNSDYYYFFYDWEIQDAPCRSAAVTVNVSADQANFNHDANASTLAVNFTDQSAGANNWNWDFGDGNSASQQNPSYTYAAAGVYVVQLTINGNCSFTDTVTVGPTATQSWSNGTDVRLLPNPSLGQSQLQLSSALSQNLSIQLLSLDGRLLKSYELPAGQNKLDLNENLAPGFYFLRLQKAEEQLTLKWIIQD